jgi:hypothetical protein
VVDAWQRMQQLKLPRRAASAAPSLRYLGDVQARALQLSTAADQLTSHLEAASQATPLKWLNTVARQRMLCQRYTQQLLLQRWLRQGDAAGVLQAAQSDTRQELQAVLSQLNHLPLRNEAIDACLTQVGADWMALLHAGQHLLALPVGQGAEAHAVLTVVFERSEAVLTGFETLTRHFETSLEWLLA